MYKAYMNRGNNDDELDNKKIFSRIVVLRVEKANLLGFKTYSDFVLQKKMAKTPDNVYSFLNEIWTPTVKRAQSEVVEMQKIIDAEGGKFKLEPWDWWYYAEKVKKEKYALDEEMLRPYFKLENVIDGVFQVGHTINDPVDERRAGLVLDRDLSGVTGGAGRVEYTLRMVSRTAARARGVLVSFVVLVTLIGVVPWSPRVTLAMNAVSSSSGCAAVERARGGLQPLDLLQAAGGPERIDGPHLGREDDSQARRSGQEGKRRQ